MTSASAFLYICLLAISSIGTVHAGQRPHPKCAKADCKAVADKDGEAIRASVNNGVDLCSCVCDRNLNTILHLAGPVECVVCAEVLIDPPLKCPLDVLDFNMNTPLHDAAKACQSPMTNVISFSLQSLTSVAAFLDKGAEPDVKNAFGKTPLCLAVRVEEEKCAGVAQDLIKKGADKCKKWNGFTPYELAANKVTKDVNMCRS